ncbi:ParB/RepB/Spo0J family partition protein [Petrocella sp. FN5]|uniref:ParB/RepB/Spo0J family partition protein n=1 Tax=Petrocella sp. FN5 TaxID=3032002 RepID=UPI0023DC2327|nr:ParB/RepB/Spo0J family partition protein [Petrocella sp. FN5]MDF1617421.1 ParB/RepB/Spo0J family partition protein [Petrocella sp. FN5]
MNPDLSYQVFQVPIESIRPNPNQPRYRFDDDMLSELAESIRLYGIMQPISVRLIETNQYELVAGERRLRAAKLLYMTSIPALIINVTEKDSAILALIENLQRENLNYIEEAKGFAQLISNYGLKQQELANQLGKSQSSIANKLRLLNLSEKVQEVLLNADLTERHGRILLKLEKEEDQLVILERMINEKLNVSQSEKLVNKILANQSLNKEEVLEKAMVKGYLKDIRLFTNTIKQAVDMVKHSGIDINYQIKQTEEAYEISIRIPMED